MNAKRADRADILIAARLRAHRLSRGLSQMALAKKLGVSFQQLQKYEKGTNRIGSGRLQKAAAALGLPITAFFPADPKATKQSEPEALIALLAQPQAARLLSAFHAIADTQRRLALVRLAEGMAREGRRSKR